MERIQIGIIGAGRIGRVHAENIAKSVPQMEIRTVADPYMSPEAESFLRDLRIPNLSRDPDDILQDPDIRAVIVCSPTDWHAEYVIRAARAGKDVFVEKPIDYRLERVHEAIDAAKAAGVKLQVGFNRRFDRHHHAVYEAVRAGKVGQVNLVKISSRDPESPTIDYVKVSGGIFYDMMVHDFDMARFLAGSEVTEVFACGAVLVDPAIGEAGDVDTAVVTLKFANGAMGVIDNSYCGDDDQWMFPAIAFQDTNIPKGTRICQFRIVEKQPPVKFETVAHLTGPNRGGFGSTGN